MPTGKRASRARKGCRRKPQAEPFRSIWLCSTTLLSARRPRSRPKFISPADPAARWTGALGGQAFFAYSTNYLIDVDNAIIIDVEATTAFTLFQRSPDDAPGLPMAALSDNNSSKKSVIRWMSVQVLVHPGNVG